MSESGPAIQNTLQWEGGFSDDPQDSGNWTGGKIEEGELRGTNFGLSAATYPTLDLKNLTKEEAIGIYIRDWWDSGPYAQILDQTIANKCFDLAVNMGIHEMTVIVQRAVNDAGLQLSVDGEFGPNTLRSVNAIFPDDLLPKIRQEAETNYSRIVAQTPSKIKFLAGWLKRARS